MRGENERDHQTECSGANKAGLPPTSSLGPGLPHCGKHSSARRQYHLSLVEAHTMNDRKNNVSGGGVFLVTSQRIREMGAQPLLLLLQYTISRMEVRCRRLGWESDRSCLMMETDTVEGVVLVFTDVWIRGWMCVCDVVLCEKYSSFPPPQFPSRLCSSEDHPPASVEFQIFVFHDYSIWCHVSRPGTRRRDKKFVNEPFVARRKMSRRKGYSSNYTYTNYRS
jgi:hypothetical protein